MIELPDRDLPKTSVARGNTSSVDCTVLAASLFSLRMFARKDVFGQCSSPFI